ncbi:MAG: heme exporter protein CcmB [Gammaproteobacteria bacterium]|nr:heme exporter protein CcmB [Gammaproteobacteria bacterium]
MTIWHYFLRDLKLYFRNASELTTPLIFFLIAIAMFPLGVSPESALLRPISFGLVWVVALFCMQFSLDTLYRDDFSSGALEQLVQHEVPLAVIAISRTLVYWVCFGVPIAIMAPVLGLMLAMESSGFGVLSLTLLVGTMGMASIGAIGSALTVSLKKGSVVMTLIVLPMFVPFLIFGSGAVNAAITGANVSPPLTALVGITVLALSICPPAIAASIKMSVENG